MISESERRGESSNSRPVRSIQCCRCAFRRRVQAVLTWAVEQIKCAERCGGAASTVGPIRGILNFPLMQQTSGNIQSFLMVTLKGERSWNCDPLKSVRSCGRNFLPHFSAFQCFAQGASSLQHNHATIDPSIPSPFEIPRNCCDTRQSWQPNH